MWRKEWRGDVVGVDEAETRTKDRRNATQLANNGSMHSLSNNKTFKQDVQWYFRVVETGGLWRVLSSRGEADGLRNSPERFACLKYAGGAIY